MAIADENVFILLENSGYGFNNRGGLIYWEAVLSVLFPGPKEGQLLQQSLFSSCHEYIANFDEKLHHTSIRKFSPVFGVTINNSHS